MKSTDTNISIFMCGDVMTGRGIDQLLPYPSKRFIPELYVKDAAVYVQIAENANGAIERPASWLEKALKRESAKIDTGPDKFHFKK